MHGGVGAVLRGRFASTGYNRRLIRPAATEARAMRDVDGADRCRCEPRPARSQRRDAAALAGSRGYRHMVALLEAGGAR